MDFISYCTFFNLSFFNHLRAMVNYEVSITPFPSISFAYQLPYYQEYFTVYFVKWYISQCFLLRILLADNNIKNAQAHYSRPEHFYDSTSVLNVRPNMMLFRKSETRLKRTLNLKSDWHGVCQMSQKKLVLLNYYSNTHYFTWHVVFRYLVHILCNILLYCTVFFYTKSSFHQPCNLLSISSLNPVPSYRPVTNILYTYWWQLLKIPFHYSTSAFLSHSPFHITPTLLHFTVLYCTLTFLFLLCHSSVPWHSSSQSTTLLYSTSTFLHSSDPQSFLLSISPHYCTSIFLIYFSITSIFLPHSPSLPASAHEETVLIIYPLYISQAIRGFSFVIMYE